jgi:hypothetical protein
MRACERETRESSTQKLACGLRPSTTGICWLANTGSVPPHTRRRPSGSLTAPATSPNCVTAVAAAAPAAQHVHLHRLGPAAQHQRSRLRKRARWSSGRPCSTSTVTRVSLSPAWSSSRAATLTASPKQSPPISTTSPRASATCRRSARSPTRRRARCRGARCPRAPRASAWPPARRGAVVEDGHQAVAQRLDRLAAVLGHRPRQRVDAVRDDRGGLGIAQRLEQRGAAAQVGKQDGAVGDLRHVHGLCKVYRASLCLAGRPLRDRPPSGRPTSAACGVTGCPGTCAACAFGAGCVAPLRTARAFGPTYPAHQCACGVRGCPGTCAACPSGSGA